MPENFTIKAVPTVYADIKQRRTITSKAVWRYCNTPKHTLAECGDTFRIVSWLTAQPGQTATMRQIQNALPSITERRLYDLVRELRSDLPGKLNLVVKV